LQAYKAVGVLNCLLIFVSLTVFLLDFVCLLLKSFLKSFHVWNYFPENDCFWQHYQVLGFDINETRITDLSANIDITKEADLGALKDVLGNGLALSSDVSLLQDCNVYIVTVPTPIDQFKSPDLKPLCHL
jgi:hypothetical protein